MDKNEEFDLDFDFEKEYGFDPNTIMDSEYDDINVDFGKAFLDDAAPGEAAAQEPVIELTEEVPVPVEEVPAESPEEPAAEPASEDKPEESAPTPPPRRRKKKSKMRQFKEVYLPAIIAGVAAILILVFIIGSISRAIAKGKEDKQNALDASQAAEDAAQQLDADAARITQEAAELAAGYDYEGAIALLDSFAGELSAYPDMLAARSNYNTQLSQLKAWSDPSDVTNLSFHVLIADPSRAFTAATYGNSYNKNFVTTDEFSKILEQLYSNGYVLVDLDDVVTASLAADGTTTYSANTIYLPEGKKPIMITETLVNYLTYMIDSDDDDVADAGGSGFASKLVLENGKIKAEMVTSSGETVVGDYDLVPILETFIEAHPDFSYRGARAILGVCGYEGVFGYRTNTGDSAEIAGAQEIVQALRDTGYTIACYSYSNTNYGSSSNNATAIKADLEKWHSEVTPVLGDVDVLIYAGGGDLSEYSGNKYNVIYSFGFRYFIGAGSSPWAEVKSDYFRQTRLMVTGSQMAYASSTFSDYFSSMSILNSQRGTVPN